MNSQTLSMSKGISGMRMISPSSSYPSIKSNPSCVSSHHLHHHNPVVRLSSSMLTVNSIVTTATAESKPRSNQFLPDRYQWSGNSHYAQSFFYKLLRNIKVLCPHGSELECPFDGNYQSPLKNHENYFPSSYTG